MNTKTTTAARHTIRDALVRKARATAGMKCSTLIMLGKHRGNPASVRAARAFAKSIRSNRPHPHRWQLDRIIAALSNGACDVDESACRITRHPSSLLDDRDMLFALAQASRRSPS
ncbi:hypothetical protein [Amaricoccus macauensis]|uniref:hypothetical protein n=1 Tax=Amaricoccus macauensis TaxID=57001 RepID=UPI003C7C2B20